MPEDIDRVTTPAPASATVRILRALDSACEGAERGQLVSVGGLCGLYVGTDRTGAVWLCVRHDHFERTCADFDVLEERTGHDTI
jgi:hypothetical protein